MRGVTPWSLVTTERAPEETRAHPRFSILTFCNPGMKNRTLRGRTTGTTREWLDHPAEASSRQRTSPPKPLLIPLRRHLVRRP